MQEAAMMQWCMVLSIRVVDVLLPDVVKRVVDSSTSNPSGFDWLNVGIRLTSEMSRRKQSAKLGLAACSAVVSQAWVYAMPRPNATQLS